MKGVTATLPDGYRTVIGSASAVGYAPFGVVPVHLSKAVGICAICECTGIPPSHTVAFSDSNSDIEAVAAAVVGISIGDDYEVLVDVADIVTPSVSRDDLAWALRATDLASNDPSGG